MSLFGKSSVFMLAVLVVAAPRFALADDDGTVVTSKLYVDTTKVPYQWDKGTNNANVGKVLTLGSSGSVGLEAVPTPANMEVTTNKLNGTSTSGQKIGDLTAGPGAGQDQVMYPSAAAVKQYAVQKPSDAANGKVLAYPTTGTVTADTRPVAAYVKVPVATGDPSAASNPATPTDFASIWIQ